MAEIKTIDKLPKVFLCYIADRLGYRAWDNNELKGVTENTTKSELADFISRSLPLD